MIELSLRRGGLFFPASVCAAYLAPAEGAALLREGDDLMIIPVLHPGAGGFLLKQRSRSGDRVIHAGPFLCENGLDDGPRRLAAYWDEAGNRLIVSGLFDATAPAG